MPLSTSYTVAEASASSARSRRSFRQAPVFLGLFTFQIVVGAAVVLVPGNLIHLILNTQVLEGVITPMTLILILVLANRRSLLGSAANGPFARTVGRPGHRAAVAVVAAVYVVLTVLQLVWCGLTGHLRSGPLSDAAPFAPDQGVRGGCGFHVGPSRDIRLPKTPRQKWIETKESWERSLHIEVPAPLPAAPPRPGGLRVAFLTYRGNPAVAARASTPAI